MRLADGAEEFAREIEAAAAGAAESGPRLRAFAVENTWDARAAELERWLTGVRAHGNVHNARTVKREP